jgi:hypothetical protein
MEILQFLKRTHNMKFLTVNHQTTKEKTNGRAIAQGVSGWLPIAAAWVRARFWSSEICGGLQISHYTQI